MFLRTYGESSSFEVPYLFYSVYNSKDFAWRSAEMQWLQKNFTGNLLSTDDTVSQVLSTLPSVSLALLIIYFFAFGIPSFIYFFTFGIPSFIYFFAFGIPSFIYFFAFGIPSFIYGISFPSVSLDLFISFPSVSLALFKFIYFFIIKDW